MDTRKMEHSPAEAFRRMPIISTSLDDLTTPGVLVEIQPHDAERLGAFRERALSFEAAFDASIDLGAYIMKPLK
jgi:hypothetical protein